MRLRNVKNKQNILSSSTLLIKDYKDIKGSWNKLFNNNNPIYIEIGMGKGDFILGNALMHPNINFIGIEKYDSVIARAIQKIEGREEEKIKNAINFLNLGISVDIVAQGTGLSLEEVNKIKDELNK